MSNEEQEHQSTHAIDERVCQFGKKYKVDNQQRHISQLNKELIGQKKNEFVKSEKDYKSC